MHVGFTGRTESSRCVSYCYTCTSTHGCDVQSNTTVSLLCFYQVTPWVSISVKADELAVKLSECSGHGCHFLPLAPPTVEHLHRWPGDKEGKRLFFSVWVIIWLYGQIEKKKSLPYLNLISNLIRRVIPTQDVDSVSHTNSTCVEASTLKRPLSFPHTGIRTKTVHLDGETV